MMNRQTTSSIRRRRLMLWLFIGFLTVLSIGILLMPVGNILKEKTKIVMYLSGFIFWIGAIGTACVTFKINLARKGSHRFNKQYGNRKQLGIIHFFQNKEAMIADIAMFVSIIGFVIAKIVTSQLILQYLFFSIFIFSFGMHCMLNGINYKYLKFKVRKDGES